MKLKLIAFFSLMMASQVTSQEPPTQAMKIDYSKWSAYAVSLQRCSPGQFQLPDPLRISRIRIRYQNIKTLEPQEEKNELSKALITYQIFGMKEDKCYVLIKDEQQSETTNPAPYGKECYFSQDDLSALANTARKIASGKFFLFTEDPDASIKGRACKENVPSIPPLPPRPEKNTRWS